MECLTEYETRYGIPDSASSRDGFVTYRESNVGDWESCRSICKSKGAEWFDWNNDLKKCFCKSQQYWEMLFSSLVANRNFFIQRASCKIINLVIALVLNQWGTFFYQNPLTNMKGDVVH